MKFSWRYILLSLALAALLVLAFLKPSILMVYLVEPLTRILWFAFRLLRTVDEQVYWTLLIFAAFTLLVKLVPVRRQAPGRSAYADMLSLEDRVAVWETMIQSAQDDPEARLALQQALRDLDHSVNNLVEDGETDEITLAPVKPGIRRSKRVRKVYTFLSRWVPVAKNPSDIQFEKRLEQLLGSMETKMEIDHDPTTRHNDD